ncbi:TIGR00270 family protein [Methanocalculus taiwanensis]|uniref:TIGR00270 family protein n=1 Tax=Methanocalculus taiwanensis TaxID=106207 RepID=A0ABD4TGU1_9EURY|nr:multiprotein bridging factor aMBF1 [Methanocalculus taiwanensis]MCQ1537951.1 TIGR00270 family protein [Methanocalculus taiwanensis]
MQPQHCEACGELIRGRSKIVRIEGSKPMKVCDRCARLGTEVQVQTGPRPSSGRTGVGVSQSSGRTATPPVRRRRDVFDLIGGDIVEDYADRIREARLEKGMSQKDLALEMKEKEHLIKKIENRELIPEDSVRKKLEAVLDIHLIESEGMPDDGGGHAEATGTTLGDVIQIKRK